MNRVAGILAWFVLPLALASGAEADGWREVPLYGADVRSLAFDPSTADRVLAGTSSGQVYESLDAGATWSPAGDRVALPGWVVSAIRFDPHREGRVWAALWALWGADGTVAVSNDGGRTWTPSGEGLPRRQVYTLELATDRPDELFAATRDGVWGSRDGGASWQPLTAAHPGMGKITSLLVDPHSPEILYAGSWRRAYRSDDRGRTWRGIFEGMVLDSEVFSLVPGPGGEGELWASTCGWVYRSPNRGGRWRRHTNGLAERRTPSFAALSSGRLLAGTVAGVYSSDDRGTRWTRRGPKVAVSAIASHPSRPALVLVASEGSGVWRSTDGASTFSASASGLVGLRVTDVVATGPELTFSVRHAEGNDGIHRLGSYGLRLDSGGELPTVLDLAADGAEVYAATERGVWHRTAAGWRRLEELGDMRYTSVVAVDGRIVALRRDGAVSLHGGTVESFEMLDLDHLVYWSGAAWFINGRQLMRWNLEKDGSVELRGNAETVELFADTLVTFWRDEWSGQKDGRWRRLFDVPPRVLPTGDRDLPYLGLWYNGRATLHDTGGRRKAELKLPVRSRDVSASVILDGRLHLATAGHGLIWSNLLLLAEGDGEAGVERAAVSSR